MLSKIKSLTNATPAQKTVNGSWTAYVGFGFVASWTRWYCIRYTVPAKANTHIQALLGMVILYHDDESWFPCRPESPCKLLHS